MTKTHKTIWTIIVSAVILISLDAGFLLAHSESVNTQITRIQRVAPQYRYESAVLCYVIVLSALYYFILREHKSPLDAFFLGAIINGIYETTNYATFKKWEFETVIKDTIWGGILFAITTWATYQITAKPY